jgi:DNA-binding transcriptional LysR family regulator
VERHINPTDLHPRSFPFLSFLEDSQQKWALSGPNAATTVISFDPVLRSSDFTILLRAAAAGLGIALFPAEVVEDEIRTKRLMRILPDWHREKVVHLIFTTNRGIVPAVRVLIDYLAEHFKFRFDKDPKSKKLEVTHSESPRSRPAGAT